VQKLSLAERSALGGRMRDVHEQSEGRALLACAPVEREVIEKIAEIASSRARRCSGKAASSEMRCKLGCRQSRVEPVRTLREHHSGGRQGTLRVGTRSGAVMRRSLDAEGLRALAQAKVNHHMRLQSIVQG